jgi:hypothetical protein
MVDRDGTIRAREMNMQHVIKSTFRGNPRVSVFLRDNGGNRPSGQRFEFTSDRKRACIYPDRATAREALHEAEVWSSAWCGAVLRRTYLRAVVVPAQREGMSSAAGYP